MGHYTSNLKEHTMNCSLSSHVFVLEGTYHYNMVAAAVINILISIPIVSMNLLIIIVIYKTRLLHTPSNILLQVTAIFDLLVGLVSMPLYSAHLLMLNFSYRHDCDLVQASWVLLHSTTNMSFIMVSIVSIDRYIAIYYPFYYEEKITVNSQRYIYISALLWVCLLVFVIICVLKGESVAVQTQELVIYIVSVLGGVVIHTKIYLTVRKINMSISSIEMGYQTSTRKFEKQKLYNANRERKVALMTSFMLLSLVVFHLPYGVVGALWMVTPPNSNMSLSIMITWSFTFLSVKSLTNPLLYSYTMTNIRTKVKDLVKGLKLVPPASKEAATWRIREGIYNHMS